MLRGKIFDIKEFSINDGPGVRVTVFMKGCPLRCLWCHNPEGISKEPVFNNHTKQYVGKEWTVDEMVNRLRSYEQFFREFDGGVTFSGGEPSAQAEFLYECAVRMPYIHKVLDTSGYCDTNWFLKLSEVFELFYFDLKLVEEEEHVNYTGVSNRKILGNLELLMEKKKRTVIRMPMIPDITDTKSNLEQAVDLIRCLCPKEQIEIHLLPYNEFAGGKYPVYGMIYPLKETYRRNNRKAVKDFEKKMRTIDYTVRNYVEGDDTNE